MPLYGTEIRLIREMEGSFGTGGGGILGGKDYGSILWAPSTAHSKIASLHRAVPYPTVSPKP